MNTIVGDRVWLVSAGSVFTYSGRLVAEGATGTIVGHQGDTPIVSWHGLNETGLCPAELLGRAPR